MGSCSIYPLCLAYFTQHKVLKVQPQGCHIDADSLPLKNFFLIFIYLAVPDLVVVRGIFSSPTRYRTQAPCIWKPEILATGLPKKPLPSFLRLNTIPLRNFPVVHPGKQIKNLLAVQETQVWSLGWKDPLEKGMATHSSILAWRIRWTEEPGGLRSTGSQRVRQQLSPDYTTVWIDHILVFPCISWWTLRLFTPFGICD